MSQIKVGHNTESNHMFKSPNGDIGTLKLVDLGPWQQKSYGRTFNLRVRNENLNFIFLNQNICCGYSKEPSQ